MLLAVSIVCAMVYLIICALGNGVDGQNLSKKPQDVIQTGPAWAEDKLFSSCIIIINNSSTLTGLLCLRWLPLRLFHSYEKRPGLAEVILH